MNAVGTIHTIVFRSRSARLFSSPLFWLFLFTTGVFLLIGILIYPASWAQLSVFRLLCGADVSYANTGTCQLRWVFYLAIIAVFDAIVLGVLAFILASKQDKLTNDMQFSDYYPPAKGQSRLLNVDTFLAKFHWICFEKILIKFLLFSMNDDWNCNPNLIGLVIIIKLTLLYRNYLIWEDTWTISSKYRFQLP